MCGVRSCSSDLLITSLSTVTASAQGMRFIHLLRYTSKYLLLLLLLLLPSYYLTLPSLSLSHTLLLFSNTHIVDLVM
jgi:hypothetical protein